MSQSHVSFRSERSTGPAAFRAGVNGGAAGPAGSAVFSESAECLTACGEAAVAYAKAACPVDTGRLRDSITFRVDAEAKTVTIGTSVPYAVYVEFGHTAPAACPAQPFIKPAVADHTDVYRDIIADILSGG